MSEQDQPKMKKKKSSAERLFARYKTYEGEPGSPEQWASAAASLMDPLVAGYLKALGLTQVPKTADELKQARRQAIRIAHPDAKSGTHDAAATINAAYDRLEKMLPKPVRPVGDLPPPSALLVVPPRCTAELPQVVSTEPLSHAWTSDLVAEVKLNGERELLYLGFDPYGRRSGTTMLSRQKSKSDGLFGDKTEQVPHITGVDCVELLHTVLDGEVFARDWVYTHSVMGSSPAIAVDNQREEKLVFYVFDMPYHKGQDIRKLPYDERRKLLTQVVAELGSPWVKVVEQFTGDLDLAFRRITEAGGEGLVIKNRRSGYGQSWAKYKKASDVSVFITGFTEGKKALAGMVGSVEIGVYKDGVVHCIGNVSGFTNALRMDITNNRKAYLGRVMDVFAFELTRDEQLLNPTFHRFREDVSPEDCTLEKAKADFKHIKGNRTK